jgi:hypothetical protein
VSDAQVRFDTLEYLEAKPGEEQTFGFKCPLRGRRCEGLVVAGKTDLKRDPQGHNGGIAQWDWNGNRDRPTFSPSINCGGCWHGYIENGRCVSVQKTDEPEPETSRCLPK